MGYIEKLPNKRVKATYRINGRERSKTFDSARDARQFLANVEVSKATGAFVDPKLGRKLFSTWCEQWWSTTIGNRPSTRARDDSHLRNHVLPGFGSRRLIDIEYMDVQVWVADLDTKLAPATVHKVYQLLAKIMDSAVKARLLAVSPCIDVELPKIEREEMRFLNPAEVARLADAIHPQYRALILLASYAGLRGGEFAGLRRARVDLLRGRIRVVENVVEVRGKLHHGTPKTKSGTRTIGLPGPVAAELREHLNTWAGDDFVFPSPQGGPLRVNAWRRRFWKPAVEAANLAPLTCHALRHSGVAFWIAAGANVLEVSRRAGHSSVAFTLDRYGHLFDDADDVLSDRLGGLYIGPDGVPNATITALS